MIGGLYTEVDGITRTPVRPTPGRPDATEPRKERIAMGVDADAGKVKRLTEFMPAAPRGGSWNCALTRDIAGIKPSLFVAVTAGTCDKEARVVVLPDVEKVLGIRDEPGGQGT